jgi:hypothetical protein
VGLDLYLFLFGQSDGLRSGLEELKAVGQAGPSQNIIAYNVECVPK